MAALTVDFKKHSGPTPADDMAAQIITNCGNFTLDFKQHGLCASPLFLQNLGPWFPNAMLNFSFIWKEDFGPLSNSPVIFLLSPGKMLLTMFLFQKWLGSPFPERGDSWCTVLQLHSTTFFEALTSVFESAVAWQYSHACGHPCCFCTFSYPISSFQSTLHFKCDFKCKRYPEFCYCRDGHLLILKCKYSNILRHWNFFTIFYFF